MPQSHTSKARLRTRTGCLICRQHKKKCDEHKPSCNRCMSASVECKWPSPADLAEDRRHHKARKIAPAAAAAAATATAVSTGTSTSTPESHPDQPQAVDAWIKPAFNESSDDDFGLTDFMDLMIDWAPDAMSPVIDVDDQTQLFDYWYMQFLPSLVHGQSNPRYLDFSYPRQLALDHAPLRDAAMACAALSLFQKASTDEASMKILRAKALFHHTSAVAAVRHELTSGSVDGTEDWLLATIYCLTLFDSRDPQGRPDNSVTHVMASVQLFKTREAFKPVDPYLAQRPVTPENNSRLCFERMCYESLLYFGTILMLYDESFDALLGNTVWRMIDNYFYTSPLPHDDERANWPILGMPYRLCRLIVAISRFGRMGPLSGDDLANASNVLNELGQWSGLFDAKGVPISALFVYTARVQLQRILSREAKTPDYERAIRSEFEHCVALLREIEHNLLFSRSLVWPLCILNAECTNSEEKAFIRNMMGKSLQSSDGGGIRPISEDRIDLFLKVSSI